VIVTSKDKPWCTLGPSCGPRAGLLLHPLNIHPSSHPYFTEMQPGVIRAQKREIQISREKKFSSFYYGTGSLFYNCYGTFIMELEVFFTIVQQAYSKTSYKS
jgi:hypothetical protein